jgi:glycosyltransferase involved in cell wall biosynthesis
MRVSCITPTFNRREFWPRCIRFFNTQDYPDLEWVILDNGTDPIADLLPNDSRIKYFRVGGPRLTHGELMNLGFAHTSVESEIGIVWDDDDWYAPDRITRQVAPFADPTVAVTGTSRLYYYIHGTKQAYRYQNWTTQKWIGAIAIRKSVWITHRFQNLPSGADVRWLQGVPEDQWRDLNDLTLLIAAIHPDNEKNGKRIPSISFIETPWETIEQILGEQTLESV